MQDEVQLGSDRRAQCVRTTSSMLAFVTVAIAAASLGCSDGEVQRLGETRQAATREEVGEWTAVQDWAGTVSVHAHLLPTGKILMWAYGDDTDNKYWDPENPAAAPVQAPIDNRNIFCAGHSFLPDGTLFTPGGHIRNNVGLDTASIFNPWPTATWVPIVPTMNAGRWYPSSTTLWNGDVLVSSGHDTHRINELSQVWEIANDDWRDLTTALATGEVQLPMYPRTFMVSDGRVFFATAISRLLDTSETGSWEDVAMRNIADRDNYGSAVMYEQDKILWCGGGDPPTDTCEMIDLGPYLNGGTPVSWQSTAPMWAARRQNNLTLLPDGTVFANGGSAERGFDNPGGANLTPQIWDPATDTWTTMGDEAAYRGYHSTTVLLPDGSVLSSGGDDSPNGQVFFPPYMFSTTPQPVITNWADPTDGTDGTSVEWGENFQVTYTGNVTAVNLLRLGSLTHAQNWSQRINKLSFSDDGAGTLTVLAPESGYVAPPGYYLLFLVNADRPSVGKMLRLGHYCGDSVCSTDEDACSCSKDCTGMCVGSCGDGTCDASEDCSTCAADCGACSTCGDGTCDATEDCSSCAADCGACSTCGDGVCDAAENCGSCEADCGVCPTCGGNGAACTDAADCCSNNCRRNTCRGG